METTTTINNHRICIFFKDDKMFGLTIKQIYRNTMNRGGYIKLKISLFFMGRICKSRGALGCGDDKDSLRGEIGNHLVSFRLLGQGVAP